MYMLAPPFSLYGCLVCVWETITVIKGKSQDKESHEIFPTIAIVSFSISGLLFNIHQTIIYKMNYFKSNLVHVSGCRRFCVRANY